MTERYTKASAPACMIYLVMLLASFEAIRHLASLSMTIFLEDTEWSERHNE